MFLVIYIGIIFTCTLQQTIPEYILPGKHDSVIAYNIQSLWLVEAWPCPIHFISTQFRVNEMPQLRRKQEFF